MLSALIVGSMAPDFHYFLNLAPSWHFTHTIEGAFVYCLPLGLAVLWIFQTVMKRPLIALAPEQHQSRLVVMATPFRWGPAWRFVLIVGSLLLGVLSHLVWDACTHERGRFVRNIPDMRAPLFEEFGSQRPLYSFLQHGSSVLGMALLVFWYWRWFKRTSPQPVPAYLKLSSGTRTWTITLALMIACGVSLADGYVGSYRLASWSRFASTSAVAFMSSVFLEALVFSLWWQWWRVRADRKGLSP